MPNDKKCTVCGKVKPIEEFSPIRKNELPRQSSCKACERKRMRVYDKRLRAGYQPNHTEVENITPSGMKVCIRCGKEKPLECFAKQPYLPHRVNVCRDCLNKNSKERQRRKRQENRGKYDYGY